MFSRERKPLKGAKGAKFLPNILLAPILSILFLVIGQVIGTILFASLRSHFYTPSIRLLFSLIFSFSFITLLLFTWVKFIEKRAISSLGFCKENFLKKYLIGFTFGFAMFTSVILLLFITGHVVVDKNPIIPVGLSALSSILIILPGWIIQSGTEETLTRGWLMNVLGVRYNVPLGLFVSSSLFGFFHLLNANVTLLSIVNIVIVGIFLGLYVLKSQDLWGACGLHCAWNWAQGNIFGLEVSGASVSNGSLLKLKLSGAQWITGGVFGPEGGVASTIILLTGIFILFIILKKEKINSNKTGNLYY